MTASVIPLYPVPVGARVSLESGATGYVLALVRKPGAALRARIPVGGVTYVVPVDRLRLEPREPVNV